jgi:chorismate mutase
MPVRGIRGAISVTEDRAIAILDCTRSLLIAIQQANPGLRTENIASVWFTTTPDLTAVAPARAARDLGWTLVPLMCAMEMPVAGSLPCIIRVLVHWNTDLPQTAVHHVYLGAAAALRPDLTD